MIQFKDGFLSQSAQRPQSKTKGKSRRINDPAALFLDNSHIVL